MSRGEGGSCSACGFVVDYFFSDQENKGGSGLPSVMARVHGAAIRGAGSGSSSRVSVLTTSIGKPISFELSVRVECEASLPAAVRCCSRTGRGLHEPVRMDAVVTASGAHSWVCFLCDVEMLRLENRCHCRTRKSRWLHSCDFFARKVCKRLVFAEGQ